MRDESAAGRTSGSDYFRGLRRHWQLVAAGLVIGSVAALAYLQWAPREFRAETSVLVTSTTAGSAAGDRSAAINLDTEAQLVLGTATVASAAERLAVASDEARDLRERVRVSVPPNSQVLDIAFTGTSPVDAQRGSLAFAEAYLEQREVSAQAALDSADEALGTQIEEIDADLRTALGDAVSLPDVGPVRRQSDVRIADLNAQLARLSSQQNAIRSAVVTPGRIIAQPVAPSTPSSPDRLVTWTAGIALGLLAGVGLAVARQRSDDRVRSAGELFRATGLPVAAALSAPLRPDDVAIVAPLSADGRGYASLRNLVMAELGQAGHRVTLVAGTRRSSGSVATNLAVALARAGEEVVLVCADVRSPTSSALLDGANGPGLMEVLDGRIDLERATQRVDGVPGLRVLGAGRDLDRAHQLLETSRVQTLVDELLGTAAYVVIEAPSAVDNPAAQTLARVADVALLVVELGRTRSRDVLDACEQFEAMGTPVLGAVTAPSTSARGHSSPPAASAARRTPEARPAAARSDDHGSPAGRAPVVTVSTSASPLTSDDRDVAPR